MSTKFRSGAALYLAALCMILQGCSEPSPGPVEKADVNPEAASDITYLSPQYNWQSPPEQASAEEGFLDVGGANLWYWDTGGDGEVVVFSHPASGSALTWEYQQPFLVEHGYRVIAYSRRGHYKTEITDSEATSTATDDLLKLVDHLGVDQFHIVALAAGAHIAPDFATSYPDRILSLMVGVTIGRTGDPAFSASNDTLMPPEFGTLPVWVKELSSFYRGANPEGALAGTKISDLSREQRVRVNLNNEFTPELLAAIDHPTLLFTGDGDYYMPPSRLRAYARYWTGPEVVILRGAGHAPYWEQPLAFNQMLLDFMQRNGKVAAASGQAESAGDVRWMPAQTEWTDIPEQVPVTEGYVDIDGVKLWYWDSGGDGDPVVLLHPLTGSAAIWGYQQPALAAAGFRVIAFSRRGHHKSDTGPLDNTGSAVDDIEEVANQLGLDRFHLVGSAGGGFIVPDYAVSHPERLLSITIAMSSSGIRDDTLLEQYRMLVPPELRERSTWFKELSPSYRAANPEGVAAWKALEEIAHPNGRVRQSRVNDLQWEAFASVETPTLLMTGDVDIYQPPPRLLAVAAHMVNADPEVVVLSESGHSGYWEQPDAFNEVLIDFLLRH